MMKFMNMKTDELPKVVTDDSTVDTAYSSMGMQSNSPILCEAQLRSDNSIPGIVCGGNIKNGDAQSNGKVVEAEVYLVGQKWAYLSIAFSVVQTLVVILMTARCNVAPLDVNPMLGPYPDALDRFGAKNAVLMVEEGQKWRLISPILLHAGFFHLICNLTVQLEVGAFFEKEWGSHVWFIIYITGSVGATLLSACIHPDTISVGSSGAAMALLGAKCSEVICKAREEKWTAQDSIGHEVRKQQCKGIVCHLFLIALCSFVPLVDWSCHLGGFMTGIFMGLLIFSFSIRKQRWLVLWGFTGLFFLFMYFIVTMRYLYAYSMDRLELEGEESDSKIMLRDVCAYYESSLDGYECQCSENME